MIERLKLKEPIYLLPNIIPRNELMQKGYPKHDFFVAVGYPVYFPTHLVMGVCLLKLLLKIPIHSIGEQNLIGCLFIE